MEDQATLTGAMDVLESRGVTRRSFMKLCAGVAAAAGLSQVAIPRVAEAIEKSVIGATSGDLDRRRIMHGLYGIVRPD